MAVGPGGAVLIPQAVRHRAMGRMMILDVVVPGHFGLEIGRLDLPAQALLKAREAARAHRPRIWSLVDLEEPVGAPPGDPGGESGPKTMRSRSARPPETA